MKSDFVDSQITDSKIVKKDTVKSVVFVTDNSITADSSFTHSTVIFYNPPDLTGKQSINKVVESTTTSLCKKNNDVNTSTVSSSGQQTKTTIAKKSDSKSDTQTTIDKTNKTKITTPTGVTIGVVVLALGIIIAGLLVLKRFGLIKW